MKTLAALNLDSFTVLPRPAHVVIHATRCFHWTMTAKHVSPVMSSKGRLSSRHHHLRRRNRGIRFLGNSPVICSLVATVYKRGAGHKPSGIYNSVCLSRWCLLFCESVYLYFLLRTNDGTTPMILAARLAVEGMVEELINAQADVNAVDDHGKIMLAGTSLVLTESLKLAYAIQRNVSILKMVQ